MNLVEMTTFDPYSFDNFRQRLVLEDRIEVEVTNDNGESLKTRRFLMLVEEAFYIPCRRA